MLKEKVSINKRKAEVAKWPPPRQQQLRDIFFSAMQERLRLKNCELFFAFVRLFDIPLLNPAVVVDVFGVLVPISHTHTHFCVWGDFAAFLDGQIFIKPFFSSSRGNLVSPPDSLRSCQTDGRVCLCVQIWQLISPRDDEDASWWTGDDRMTSKNEEVSSEDPTFKIVVFRCSNYDRQKKLRYPWTCSDALRKG